AALAALGGEAPAATVQEVAGESSGAAQEVARTGLIGTEDRSGESWGRLDPPSIGPGALRSLPTHKLRGIYAAAAERSSSQALRAAELWLLAERPDEALAALPVEADRGLSANLAWTRAELRIRAREQLGDLTPAHLSNAAEAAKQALKMQAAARLFERSAAEARNQDDFLGASSALLEAAECARWLAEHDHEQILLDQVEDFLSEGGAASPPADELRSRLLSER